MSLLPTEDYLSSTMSLAGWQVEVERRNFQTLSETWSSNRLVTACARAFPQQEYTFQECARGFLTCMCYTVLQKSQKSSRYDALSHCPCKVHKACVWKAQSIHYEETGANKSCCEQTSSKPVEKMMWGGATPSRSSVFVSDHFAKSLSKATSWWSQHKFCKW